MRHRPEVAGITLSSDGWAPVGLLLAGAARRGLVISKEELIEIVETNEKRRFASLMMV
ncbi:MAG: RNA 2'-phosphotransferase [Verrucomicrobiota bacterium]